MNASLPSFNVFFFEATSTESPLSSKRLSIFDTEINNCWSHFGNCLKPSGDRKMKTFLKICSLSSVHLPQLFYDIAFRQIVVECEDLEWLTPLSRQRVFVKMYFLDFFQIFTFYSGKTYNIFIAKTPWQIFVLTSRGPLPVNGGILVNGISPV